LETEQSIFQSNITMFSPDYFHTAAAPKLQDYQDYAQAHIRDRRISLSPLAKKWLRNYREPYKGFTSDGNIVPGLWKSNPNANGPTHAMVDAAQYLLSVASANEKARFRHLVTAREWRAWSNPEVRVSMQAAADITRLTENRFLSWSAAFALML